MKSITRILRHIAVNQVFATTWYQNRRLRKTIGETGTQSLTPAETAALCLEIFEKYCREAGWKIGDVRGKHVLEIGPGELIGVSLLFALYGAEEVVAHDRFEEYRPSERTRSIIRALKDLLPREALLSWDRFVAAQGDIRFETGRLEYLHGLAFESTRDGMEPASFDLICSNAVLEHVADMKACFARQAELLRPGGVAVHQVDLRSHDASEKYPLEFLEYPTWLWNLMTSKMHGPNRLRLSDYADLASRAGFAIRDIRVTLSLPEKAVESLCPKLAKPFRNRPVSDLVAQSILFSMRLIA